MAGRDDPCKRPCDHVIYLKPCLYGVVGGQIVSGDILDKKKRYFCRELAVYPGSRKYRTTGQAYKAVGK